jgi:hypothetical protein
MREGGPRGNTTPQRWSWGWGVSLSSQPPMLGRTVPLVSMAPTLKSPPTLLSSPTSTTTTIATPSFLSRPNPCFLFFLSLATESSLTSPLLMLTSPPQECRGGQPHLHGYSHARDPPPLQPSSQGGNSCDPPSPALGWVLGHPLTPATTFSHSSPHRGGGGGWLHMCNTFLKD